MMRTIQTDGDSFVYRDVSIDFYTDDYYECGDHRSETVFEAKVNGRYIKETSLNRILEAIDEWRDCQ